MESPTLITRQKDGQMRIDHDALRRILIRPEIGDSPVAIISIAGCMRTGKSFLLNFMERYMRRKGWKNCQWMGDNHTSVGVGNGGSGIFLSRGGSKRITTGVRMSSKVFKIPRKDGREVAVLLMDTQGLFDHDTPEDVNVTLLTLSTLMSSVQIFNAKHPFNSHHLRYMKTCVNFAMATAQTKEPYFMLQDLVFLIRDFPEDEEIDEFDSPFGFEYGDTYLESIIESKEGGEEQIQIRQRIKECFGNVKCFPMPFPGGRVSKKGFEGRNDELEEEFKTYVKTFVEGIANPKQLQAKMARQIPLGKEMTGREILSMVTACDNIFATKSFAAPNMMEANMKAYYASEYEEAILRYDQMMKNAFDGSKPQAEACLQQRHNEAKKQAFARFGTSENMGDGKLQKIYREHLEKTCAEHFTSIMGRNKAKHRERESVMRCTTAAAFLEYESKMLQYKVDTIEDRVLRERHELHLKEVLEKFQQEVDQASLQEKAETNLAILLSLNEERQNSLGQDERVDQLYELSAELRNECARFWMEDLKAYQQEKTLIKHERSINKKITLKYYENALTAEELKCINKLNGSMKENFSRAKEALRHGQVVPALKCNKLSDDLQKLELNQKHEEKCCVHKALVVAKKYAKELENDLRNGTTVEKLQNEKRSKQNAHRKLYCRSCSGHLEHFCGVIEQMLTDKFEEARKRNEENWDMMQNKMSAAIDGFILKGEEALLKKMADCYIEQSKLENYFQEIKTDLSKSNEDFTSLREEEEFKNLTNRRMESFQRKMEEINESNRSWRNVFSAEVPKFKKMWRGITEALKFCFNAASETIQSHPAMFGISPFSPHFSH